VRRDGREKVADALASAFLSGPWHLRSLLARGDAALNAGGEWLRSIAFDVMQRWKEAPLNDARALTRFIVTRDAFLEAWADGQIPHAVAHHFPFHPEMQAARWPVRTLDTPGDVAAWLELSSEELTWFADVAAASRRRRREVAQHYTWDWVARGERLPRLLEAPKQRLKAIQRRVLREVLEKLPVHDAAHGFVAGRSAVTHARLHTGKAVVARFDLRHFFTSVNTARAFGVLRTLGYTHEVSAVLLGLCTTRTPPAELKRAPVPDDANGEVLNQRFFMLRALEAWHFPQGAPSSPAWANLCSWWLDARLAAYAREVGLAYSRYADDLVFSGDELSMLQLSALVDTVARDEGFRVNHEKTRVMRQSTRQEVTGIVVNARPNIARTDYDALKALLHRCEKKGALSQAPGEVSEFRAELEGRVAWVAQLNASRGAKLRAQLQRIAWG
jgi:RNA-directed DNA polymerase